jgi:hypothetical protein
MILAGVSIAAGLPSLAALVRFLPVLGSNSQNVTARVDGTDPDSRPIVVVAHVDTHPVAAAPIGRTHAATGALLGWLTLVTAIEGRPAAPEWRAAIALVALEALTTLVWLARRELTVIRDMPDDNTSGLLALTSVATLVCEHRPVRDVLIVGSGACISGGHGMTAFLVRHPDARDAWVVEIDALGAGEVVASPFPARFPRPGTPSQLVRAVVAASRATGDPINVRRIAHAHSDARAALRSRTSAITLTAGLRPPAAEPAPDVANAERAARIVDGLARLGTESGYTPV